MEKRVFYTISRKNALTWLVAIVLTVSAVCRIAFYCGWKGADNVTVWTQLILPLAVCLLYCVNVLLFGKEYLYRTSIPAAVWLGLCAAAVLPNVQGLLAVAVCVGAAAVFLLYHLTYGGKIRCRWPLVIALLALCAAQFWFRREAIFRSVDARSFLFGPANVLPTIAVLITTVIMRRQTDGARHKTWGDRPDGRRVRTMPPMSCVEPFFMPNRNGASNNIHVTFDLEPIEKFIHEKRREGLKNFGITHVFIAAYVRCCAQYPALNRFLAGQRVYSRDEDIQFSMIIKKDMTVESPDTAIKLHLNPSDTAGDVYRKFDKAVEIVKNTPLDSSFDKVVELLTKLPGVVLKFGIWLLKLLDYFGLLPNALMELSPFHGSVFFTSMGSLGIPPVVHHLYDFGNLPAFVAFGCKRHELDLSDDGTVVKKKVVDCTFNLDERTVDGFYYAAVLRYMQRLLRHPERLDDAPETVLRDIE